MDSYSGTNQTSGSNETVDDLIKNIGISIGIVDICLGSVGNISTIFAIIGNRKLRSAFYMLIVNLCFIDFATATFMMPFNVASYIQGRWVFGDDHITCSIQAFFYYCCGYSSVVCLLAITINRYIGVLFPNVYDDIFSKKNLIAIVIFTWLLAPAVMVVMFFIGDPPNTIGYGWISKFSLCVINISQGENELVYQYMIFVRLLFQLFPLIIMLIMYTHIFVSVRKSGRTVAKMSLKSAESDTGCSNDVTPNITPVLARKYNAGSVDNMEKISVSSLGILKKNTFMSLSVASALNRSTVSFEDSGSGSVVHEATKGFCTDKALPLTTLYGSAPSLHKRAPTPSSTIKKSMRKRKKMDRKLLSMSVAICLVFCVVFYPSVIINLYPSSKQWDPNIHKFASFITWLNSCLNPIIYCFINPKIRSQYKRNWYSLCRALHLHHCKELPVAN